MTLIPVGDVSIAGVSDCYAVSVTNRFSSLLVEEVSGVARKIFLLRQSLYIGLIERVCLTQLYCSNLGNATVYHASNVANISNYHFT